MGKIFASADFKVDGTGHRGEIVNETVHAELCESGAFQYGNHTCMTFRWSNGTLESFDTRYEKVTPNNFTEFAKVVLENMVLDTIKVELIQPDIFNH